MNVSDINVSLLKRPIFLSTLPINGFASLPKSYLFAEIARLDILLATYPSLIDAQTDLMLVTSLRHCQSASFDRYNELRLLCANWRLGS